MCSSNVSDTANRLRKTRKKKSSAILLFPAYAVYHLHPSPRRKGRSSKRKGNHGCPFLFAPAASAAVPAPDGAMSPSWFTAKSPPGNGEPPARFGHTAKPVPATASLSSKTPFAFPTRRAIINIMVHNRGNARETADQEPTEDSRHGVHDARPHRRDADDA